MTSEPTADTSAEIGRLCSAWAYLEFVSEIALCGIIDADEKLGPIITWRLDLRARWQLILEHAYLKHSEQEIAELKLINKHLVNVTRDRNIIVHGMVHATAVVPSPPPAPIVVPVGVPLQFERVPCWTIFRGSESGKNFRISQQAVTIVRTNVQKLAQQVNLFNSTHGYQPVTKLAEQIEVAWPEAL